MNLSTQFSQRIENTIFVSGFGLFHLASRIVRVLEGPSTVSDLGVCYECAQRTRKISILCTCMYVLAIFLKKEYSFPCQIKLIQISVLSIGHECLCLSHVMEVTVAFLLCKCSGDTGVRCECSL